MTLSTVEIEAKGANQPRAPLTIKDFKGKAEPDWCPGCGDFGVLVALKQALAELGVRPHDAMVISGIGCSSNLPGYISTYGMHTLHGGPCRWPPARRWQIIISRLSSPAAMATATVSAATISFTRCAAMSMSLIS